MKLEVGTIFKTYSGDIMRVDERNLNNNIYYRCSRFYEGCVYKSSFNDELRTINHEWYSGHWFNQFGEYLPEGRRDCTVHDYDGKEILTDWIPPCLDLHLKTDIKAYDKPWWRFW